MNDPTRLPTAAELSLLPRLARIAFAARCARRVEPLFAERLTEAPDEYARAVRQAINVAFRAAAGDPPADIAAAIATAQEAERFAADQERVNAAPVAEAAGDWESVAVNPAGGSTPYPAQAAALAALRSAQSISAESVHVAGAAMLAALDATRGQGQPAAWGPALRIAMRRDFDLLRDHPDRDDWDAGAPLKQEVLGKLWPDGPPKGFPTADPRTWGGLDD